MKKVLHVHDEEHKVLKQLQANQIEDLTECWISKMEVQCVKTHIQDQLNRVWISKDFN